MPFPKLFSIVLFTLLSALTALAHADDTDLFNQPPGNVTPAPNILFVLDNTANWSKASQKWVGSDTQGEAELKAIANFVAGLTKPANVGLMMLTTTGHDGAYMRFGVRSMTDGTNNKALQDILKSIDVNAPAEKLNQSSGDYANALYESWLYLTGSKSWAGMDGNADYSGNSGLTAAGKGLSSGFAYQGSSAKSRYNTPIGTDGCARTYIIFIGNNRQGIMPPVPAATDPAITTLNTYKYSTLPDVQSAWARFLRLRPDLGTGTAAANNGAVVTFAIDAYNAQQDVQFTTMMKNMAINGDGHYYQAGSDVDLGKALNDILSRIQAVNSVFASASLPVSVSVRGTYLNQVYLGVFRPDGGAKPNWVGNLKQYKLGVDTSTTPPSVFLADNNGAAAENPITGFVNPGAVSFWTHSSSFWDPLLYVESQGVGGSSDSPDGDLVEKGGAAQYVRTSFPTDQTGRQLFTCTGTCSGGSLLSATPFDIANTDITNATLGAANKAEHDAIINWVRGSNINQDDPLNGAANLIRGFAHGDVLHSRPAVINYNRTADDIVVFYGANDGILHAVKGGQNTGNGDGNEMWGFIASEHLPQFKRMRDHTPLISSANPKPYFMDGSTTTYTHSTFTDGRIDYTRGDKAYLFITMRRGGRFVYALDVSNPDAPKFLWKRGNADVPELGQSWSDMKVATIRAQANPVLIFGLGYDPVANDPASQATATMGRGVIVLDALTGTQIWQAGPNPSGSMTKTVAGMTYAIPANVSLYDSNGDRYIDRIYAVDTGANVWRININDASPSNWTVDQLAQLGGSGPDARKFLYPADIIPATSTNNFDSILLGSGDREHPFDTYIHNRFYMIKDDHGLTATRGTPIVEAAVDSSTVTAGQLYDATADLVQVGTAAQQTAAATALATGSGWYVRLGTGEKVVSGSTTMAGTTIFGTNSPASASTNSCTGNLGEARLYMLNYLNAGATFDFDQNGSLTLLDRFQGRAGGGYPPTPVPVSVRIDGKTYQAAITGTQVITPPGSPLGRRYRTFWQRLID
jgi:type IV pilus assembly protein PilY1